MTEKIDVFQLSSEYNVLLIFDCPTKEESNYSTFSDEIVKSISEEACLVFLQTDIPPQLKRQATQHLKSLSQINVTPTPVSQINPKSGLPSNLIETYNLSAVWLLIGVFASQNNKQVRIFTDEEDSFKQKLASVCFDNKLKNNIDILKCSDVKDFSLEQSLDPWSQFENQEVLCDFEVQQLLIILKKFIKQIVTSKSPNNLEKLLNISQNLVKAHLSSIQKEKYKVSADLTFHFIRSLFLDNVLQNDIISSAILTNQISCLQDFENFTKINYTSRFQQIIDRIQSQIQAKQSQQQTQLQQNAEAELKLQQENGKIQRVEEEKELQPEQEELVIRQAIQTLFDQYLNLFQKAKIYDIKKLNKLVKQIANYVEGFVMKTQTAPKNPKDQAYAEILKNNRTLINSNLLRIIANLGLIKLVDVNQIEHDNQRVSEYLSNATLRHIKDQDIQFDKAQATFLLEQPAMAFRKEKEELKIEAQEALRQRDPVDLLIEKLYSYMKSSKHYPNTLRELERLIKKQIVKKAELQGQEEDKIVESVLKRMNEKGMFTQKNRTGEAKQDAKDPKLKNADILELYRKEKKEDIPIVLESSYINK